MAYISSYKCRVSLQTFHVGQRFVAPAPLADHSGKLKPIQRTRHNDFVFHTRIVAALAAQKIVAFLAKSQRLGVLACRFTR